MAFASNLVFKKIGGRFKLEEDDEFRSCFRAVAAAAAREAAKKHRDGRSRRLERSQLADSTSDVLDFLKKHGFNSCREDLGLNLPKRLWVSTHVPTAPSSSEEGLAHASTDLQGQQRSRLGKLFGRDEGGRLDSSSRVLLPTQTLLSSHLGKASECFGSAVHDSTRPGLCFYRAMDKLAHNSWKQPVNSLS